MSLKADQRPTKREAFLAFLQEGWVSVHLDARRLGVDVPKNLRSEPRLVLQYGRDMPLPIPDLEVSEAGVRATLSFARTPQATMVPWSAIYIIACTDGRGVLYQEDIPEELLALVQPVDAETGQPLDPLKSRENVLGAAEDAAEAGAPVRALRSIGMNETADASGTSETAGAEPVVASGKAKKRKPALRLVK